MILHLFGACPNSVSVDWLSRLSTLLREESRRTQVDRAANYLSESAYSKFPPWDSAPLKVAEDKAAPLVSDRAVGIIKFIFMVCNCYFSTTCALVTNIWLSSRFLSEPPYYIECNKTWDGSIASEALRFYILLMTIQHFSLAN